MSARLPNRSFSAPPEVHVLDPLCGLLTGSSVVRMLPSLPLKVLSALTESLRGTVWTGCLLVHGLPFPLPG